MPEPTKQRKPYVVLASPTAVTWTVVGDQEAGNAESARNKWTDAHPDDAHGPYYVAVPGRSWNPGKAIKSTTTTVKFEQVGPLATIEVES